MPKLPREVEAQLTKAHKDEPAAQYAIASYYLFLANKETDPQSQDSLRNQAIDFLLLSSRHNYLFAYLDLADIAALRGNQAEERSWRTQYNNNNNSTHLPKPQWSLSSKGNKLVFGEPEAQTPSATGNPGARSFFGRLLKAY
jgi:hypothetical protein